MAIFTINSREHGKQEFIVPANGGYVKCNGAQICYGGSFMGGTISIPSDEQLKATAKKWWSARLAKLRNM